MNDGMLATAALYIASKCSNVDSCTPREFYETISFANLGKYSIKSDKNKNIDYTAIPRKEVHKKLSESLKFIRKDIEILQPDIIILPQSIYSIVKKDFDEITKGILLLPIYQLNTRTINCTVSKKYSQKDRHLLPPYLVNWCENTKRVSIENYLHVFTYLDSVISQYSIKEN